MIRHGEAAKVAGVRDPALTELGHRQAAELAGAMDWDPAMALVSSPKSRARQTAEPLARRLERDIVIEPAVNEIPSPRDLPLAERGPWIRSLLDAKWQQLEQHQLHWREEIISYLQGLDRDTAVFCHFMVINSVVAYTRDAPEICQFRPDYTSVTELVAANGRLELVRLGRERDSRML
nr:histidine phosphatase family protein [Microbulbifer zhoushanensis]